MKAEEDGERGSQRCVREDIKRVRSGLRKTEWRRRRYRW